MTSGLMHRLQSLQLRFLLVVASGATLFALAAGSLVYSLGHDRALQSGRDTLDGLLSAIEKTAAIGAFANDQVLLQEIVDGLSRNPVVASVQALAPDGRLLAQHGTGLADAPGSQLLVLERSLYSPFSADEVVGRLRITADLGMLKAMARSQALTLALLMAGQIALAVSLLYVAAAYLVSNPIVRLAARLGRLQPGTEERLALAPWHRHDEIGTLIRSANAMLDETQAALTSERQLRAAVEAMEAQYRQIFDATSAGIFVLDIHGRLINGNPTVLKVIGSPVQQIQQLRGQDFLNLVFARPEQARAMVQEADRRHETISGDLELIHRDGVARWVHCLISVQLAPGQPDAPATLIEGVMYDVTERKHGELATRHRAEHDPLTGLKNRAFADGAIDKLIADAMAAHGALALLFIDLDGFKAVNDQLGHAAGDEVLRQCAQRMREVLRRATDVIGRVGGDEFVIAMPGLGVEDSTLAQLANELLVKLSTPIKLPDGRLAQVGASIGVACYPRHGRDRAQLAEAADQALYQVKRSGKNSFAMAKPA